MHRPVEKLTRLLKLGLCLSFIIVQLDVSIVNVALDALRASFHANISDLEWVINAYALVFAAFLLASGPFSARFGVRRVFVAGVGIFVVASIGCALSPLLSVLIGFRCLQGLGASLLVPTSLTLLRMAFDDPVERAAAIGAWSSSGALALAAGPIAGGFLISVLGWKSIFLLNVPIGLVAIWFTVRNTHADVPGAARLDLLGQALVVVALGAATFGMTEAARFGWANRLTSGAVVLGLVLFAVFLVQQTKSRAPILPPSLFGNGVFSGATFTTVISSLAFYGIVFVLSLHFQNVLHFSAARTGLAFVPMMVATAGATFLAGPLASRFSLRFIVPLGMAVSIAGFIGLANATDDWSYAMLVWATLPLGFGTAMVAPSLVTAMFAALPREQAGVASGVFASARQVGGVIGVSLFGYVIAAAGAQMTSRALNHISVICIVMMAISGLVGIVTMKRKSYSPVPAQAQPVQKTQALVEP